MEGLAGEVGVQILEAHMLGVMLAGFHRCCMADRTGRMWFASEEVMRVLAALRLLQTRSEWALATQGHDARHWAQSL